MCVSVLPFACEACALSITGSPSWICFCSCAFRFLHTIIETVRTALWCVHRCSSNFSLSLWSLLWLLCCRCLGHRLVFLLSYTITLHRATKTYLYILNLLCVPFLWATAKLLHIHTRIKFYTSRRLTNPDGLCCYWHVLVCICFLSLIVLILYISIVSCIRHFI